jgi:exopolysaccharide biosynthesis polyprenyl glycosylphosphotransferase
VEFRTLFLHFSEEPSRVSALRVATARGRWLPAWDALAAAVSIAIARGAHPGWVVPAGVGAIAAPLLLTVLSGYGVLATMPGNRLRGACDLALAAPVVVLAALAVERNGTNADVHRIVLATVLLALSWFSARVVLTNAKLHRRARALVIGSGLAAQRVAALARRHPENGLEIVGLLDDEGLTGPPGSPPLLGGLADLEQVLHDHAIDRVIVAFSRTRDEDLVTLIRRCDRDVAVDVVPRLFDVIKPHGYLLGGLPLADATPAGDDATTLRLKGLLDIVGALVALVIFAPVMVAIAIAVRLTSPGPILFWQERIGRCGEPFRVPKFRTMRVQLDDLPDELDPLDIDAIVEQLKASTANLTPIGNRLRRTSLDELPQLWCIVRRTMSLVGPRPLRAFEVESLDSWQQERMTVRPGLTGLWQVLGRSDTRWEERMRLDYMYARHWSLALDLRIMLRTVPAVVRRRGAR